MQAANYCKQSVNSAYWLQQCKRSCQNVNVQCFFVRTAPLQLAFVKCGLYASVLRPLASGWAKKRCTNDMLTAIVCIGLVQRLTKMASFDTAVPTVDISPFTAPAQHSDAARRAVGQEWDAAMTNVGFAMITGHGVDPAIVDALRQGAHSFFAGPADAKQKYCYGPYGNPLGGFTAWGSRPSRGREMTTGATAAPSRPAGAAPDLVEWPALQA